MTATIDDLISPETPDEALSYFLTELAHVGFPTTAWQSGSVAYTLLRIEALASSDKGVLCPALKKRSSSTPAVAPSSEPPRAGRPNPNAGLPAASEHCPQPSPAKAPTGASPRGRDPRLPPAGTVLRREFGGRVHEVTALEDRFEYQGAHWRSLSAVAKHIAGGTSWNGLLFFHLIPHARRSGRAA